MTTATAIHRRPLHTRTITCSGFLRDDGLIDIEGEMQDISSAGTDLIFKRVPPGGAIHHMRLTITIDRDMVIHDVAARILAGPTEYCPEIESAYAGLKGLQIRGGFRKQVKAVVGGVHGCTHLTELLGPMATTAMQSTMAIMRAERNGRRPMDGEGLMPRPALIGSCHTYRMGSPAVEVLWPVRRRQASDIADTTPSS
ncbi:DUF2889 domain-containing protein [Cupriavidus basilensis]|uniref:DUF2889 domain-containing protein n=1 Tax=Cupriavidus basilensis TaxID=68895 RepID=UPI0023E790AA|nr:DUF2889 domain-containing protein [Cupriavidus basilensis]MDF3886788.1 DUF2889 domain-containing protein [Cupriavidus basilensis]